LGPKVLGPLFWCKSRTHKALDKVYSEAMKEPELNQELNRESQNKATAFEKNNFRNNSVEKQRELGKKSGEARLLKKQEQELDSKIQEYFNSHQVPTQTGLALALGFGSRQQLIAESQNEANPLHNMLANAFSRLDEYLETQLVTSKNQVGVIFALKNRGWSDTQVIKAEAKAEVNIALDTALEETIKKIADKEIDGNSRA